MSLRTKSFLNAVFLTIFISLVIVYITVKNGNEMLENNLKREISFDTQIIENYLNNTKQELKKIAQNLSQTETVISHLNLISNYEDKNNYNALIFDQEKSTLLHYLEKYFAIDSYFEIKLYNKADTLVVQKIFNPLLGESGFVTYDTNKSYFQTKKQKIRLDTVPQLSEKQKKQKIAYEDDFYKMFEDLDIMFETQKVGHLRIAYSLNQEKLKSVSNNLIHPVSMIFNTPDRDTLDVTLLDKDLHLYLKHNIDQSHSKHKSDELIVLITLAIIFMSSFIFFFFLLFIKKEVLKPLNNLQDMLKGILNNRYKPMPKKNDDEMGKIFNTINEIFEKLWENYASLQSYQSSVDVSNLVTKTDTEGKITYANDLFCQISGYKKEEVLGLSHNIVRHPETKKETFQELWGTIKKGQTWRGILKNKTKDGGFYWIDAVVTPTYDTHKNIDGYISIRREITEFMKNKEELEFRANHDSLTKLANRNKLQADLKVMQNPCLALINIDRFSQINDFYGHEFGDKLLQEISKIFSVAVKKECSFAYTMYRHGGDEFALLVKEYKEKNIIKIVEKILQTMKKTHIILDDREIDLSFSCGISFENATKALLSADMALKLSRKEQREFVVYSKENNLAKQYKDNLLYSSKIKLAIEEDRVVPFFQPIVNNNTLAFEKYEALIRIEESDGTIISPFFFLDIAKQTKQYLKLTEIMIKKSFQVFMHSKNEFSINITVEDISNMSMQEFLFAQLDANPTIGSRVVLELVESEAIKDYDQLNIFINKAKAKGCKIAIDDFGSGYSNFEYLIKLQTDYIKIDGSLIKNINTQKESFVVVSTIVNFAKQMGIKTIAEYVETEEIFKMVKSLGIDYSQGYYFAQPAKCINPTVAKDALA
ncbi:MAG: EAL domain-containing protein [Sulfurospirillum sp.]|nr:EAL domain-containing protein [Sulfurospirillum sp.]